MRMCLGIMMRMNHPDNSSRTSVLYPVDLMLSALSKISRSRHSIKPSVNSPAAADMTDKRRP
uniref:Uncharacterized protein n=1 Tax=Anguilla anguilla TaxID=7936 RepID=A0A0E9SA66_ANGAN